MARPRRPTSSTCTIVDLDFLITKDKPEENDKLQDILTPNSVFEDAARGEAALRTVRKGDVIQIERRGFYICDAPYVRPSEPVRLLFVPDGKNLMGVKRAASPAEDRDFDVCLGAHGRRASTVDRVDAARRRPGRECHWEHVWCGDWWSSSGRGIDCET